MEGTLALFVASKDYRVEIRLVEQVSIDLWEPCNSTKGDFFKWIWALPRRGGGLAYIVWSTFLWGGGGGSEIFFCPGILQGYYLVIVCDFPAVHWIFIEQT